VTYLGEPITVGTITFLPKAESGIKLRGLIDQGKYKIEPKVGPNPDRIESRFAGPSQPAKKTRTSSARRSTSGRGLPDKYHTNSTLTADIKPGANVMDFHLEK